MIDENKEKILPPEKITPENVAYWSTTMKEVINNLGKQRGGVMKHKALLFVQNGCITYDRDAKKFYCTPLKGYNNTTYTLTPNKEWDFVCDCQGAQSKLQKGEIPHCSHYLALKFAFKCKQFGGEINESN